MGILTNVDDKRNFRVAEDKAFGLSSGEKLYSLDQLSEAINLIEPEVFRVHVNEQKNDFAAWVDGVFEEHGLAEQLRQHPTPLRMMVSIEKFLRQPMGNTEAPAPMHQEMPVEEKPAEAMPMEEAPAEEHRHEEGHHEHHDHAHADHHHEQHAA
jgi:hypothetical protein